MAMNIGEAFLDDAKQGKLIVAVKTLEGCGEIERYLNTAPCCEPIDVFRQCRLQANLVQKRRIQEMGHRANVFGHLRNEGLNIAERQGGPRTEQVPLII